MKSQLIALSLLSGLALSQVPSSKPKLIAGQLYELRVELWPKGAVPVAIRHAGRILAEKTLTEFDPTLSLYWRAHGEQAPSCEAGLRIVPVRDRLAIESSRDAANPIDVKLDRDYRALADERPYFDGKPEQGIHWYRVKHDGPKAIVAYLSVQVEDRDQPSDIETFVREAGGELRPYREGGFGYLPEATQTMPGLASFRVRRLDAGKEYLLRVAANHPAYTLRLRSYAGREGRSATEAVSMGMDFLVSLGESWHANVPRRGAVATRATLPHAEIQGCVACHPTVFTMRAYDAAQANGWGDVNPAARMKLVEQLQNHPRPFPGHEGVNWTRTIFSARAISSRAATWTRELLPYLKLTSLTHWEEEADGAAPNVSPFEIAYERYKALREPELGQRIESEEAHNVIDLNWKILGMVELKKPVRELVEKLFSYQRSDGLWPMHFNRNEAGAEFISWHALYALARAGYGLEDVRVKRLYELCLARQKESGEWQGQAQHKAFDTPFRDTQFAVMALSALVSAPARGVSAERPMGVAMSLRQSRDAAGILKLLESADAGERLTGVRVFWSQFRDLTGDRKLLDALLKVARDEQPLIRFYAANALARWYGWQADDAQVATLILETISERIVSETEVRVRSAWQQALYSSIDENEGYLAAWNLQLERESDREKTRLGLAKRNQRIQLALARTLSLAQPATKVHLLNALWDHPQRHAGLPTDLEGRSEVVLPAYFSEYQRGVTDLHRGAYEPYAQNAAFRYAAGNVFFKTRVGNDSDLPDLGLPGTELEEQLLRTLGSEDADLVRSTIKALSVFPAGLSPKLTVAVVKLSSGAYARDVRFVYQNEARANLNLEQPLDFETQLAEALLGALRPGNRDALETLLPALARVTPGDALTRNADLRGRLESLLLKPEGVPLDLALAAAAVFPHIADGPLIRTTMLEAFVSGDRALESAAVEIFVKSYVAEPTNPVLGKQFAEKARGAVRRRMLDALDPARFSLRLSALNRYNPGRDVVLPEDANLFSSDVAQRLIELGMADQDLQVKRAADELVYTYEELKMFRKPGETPALEEPDFEYFKQKVQPMLTKLNGDGRACVLCHSTQGQFALRMPGKGGFTEGQSEFNYRSALREVNRKEPKRSLLLVKPTRPNDNAGDPVLHTSTHGGGTRWGKDSRQATASEEYETILNWIRGAKP